MQHATFFKNIRRKKLLKMYLIRIHKKRLYCRDKVYLFIRMAECWNFPLGRMDQGEPERIVNSWLEDSDNLPEIFKRYYVLRIRDVLALQEAIINGYPWIKPNWLARTEQRFKQSWKCKVVGNKVIVPKEVSMETGYREILEGWRQRFPEKFKCSNFGFQNPDFEIPEKKKTRRTSYIN